MRSRLLTWLFFTFWIVYFAFFWSHALFFDQTGNFVAGTVNIWGDWAAHFTMATALATRGIFIHSPFLLNATFNYPFVADLISAVLLNLGISFQAAFVIPSFCFSILLVVSIYLFYFVLWRSPKIAILASLIFLLNGGMGFVTFFQDIATSAHPINTLIYPPHEYTRIDSLGIKWISVIDSMMIPQRAFVLGFPIALFCLTALLWLQSLPTKKSQRWQRLAAYFAVGLVIGTLPIIHTHSFLAVFIILAFWSVTDLGRHWRCWLAVFLGSCVCGLPLINYFFLQQLGQHALKWYPGWLANEYHVGWLLFWWRNWGITPLLAALGLVLQKRPKKFLFIPFALLFVLVNLFLFQPFAWDNTKLLVWASVGFAGLAASALTQLWHKFNAYGRIFVVIIFIFTILSGTIDTYRLLIFPLHSYVMYSSNEQKLARWVVQNTSINALWLTSDQHNHWLINLTGRQTLMAYRGWLWTYGYNYLPTERDVHKMFAGGDNCLQLLKQYQVQYVVIGLSEKNNFAANEAFFAEHFPVVYQIEQTAIFQVK